jgi:SAM-dependent methyltransferase
MYLLIPGRHQLLTCFQFEYLQALLKDGLYGQPDVNGTPVQTKEPITAILFAVTSANHSNTRRNPLPFYLRAMSIELFGMHLPVPVYVYGIDDVGSRKDFAAYTLKSIAHQSEGSFNCTPQNTMVVCSTPVLQMYEQLNFTILPGELENKNNWASKTLMPWSVVEHIAALDSHWHVDEQVLRHMHPASLVLWRKYRLGQKVQLLFKDDMIGSDGDLTETRDYNVYVRQMDEIAGLKYSDTAPFIQPGRIGDIGCAVGSWIKLACADEKLKEGDFYGIEVSRHLYELCRQRKENGEFDNPFVFFSQKNAVTGLVFEKNSMNTIHTSSLTHEILSYGSMNDLRQFIRNRYEELAPGGVWINRDVVGPENGQQTVLLWCDDKDGLNETDVPAFDSRDDLAAHLKQLSTRARFERFVHDFRKQEGYQFVYEEVKVNEQLYFRLSLNDAAEFLSRKDYTDNWQSEMHETFCFWSFEDWKAKLRQAGFAIHPQSYAFTNEWIAQHRWEAKAKLFSENLQPLAWPVTTMILVAVKE